MASTQRTQRTQRTQHAGWRKQSNIPTSLDQVTLRADPSGGSACPGSARHVHIRSRAANRRPACRPQRDSRRLERYPPPTSASHRMRAGSSRAEASTVTASAAAHRIIEQGECWNTQGSTKKLSVDVEVERRLTGTETPANLRPDTPSLTRNPRRPRRPARTLLLVCVLFALLDRLSGASHASRSQHSAAFIITPLIAAC